MNFANQTMLMLLLVIPPGMLLFFWWSWRTRARLLTQFIQARLLPTLTLGISPRRQKFRLACLVLGVSFVILALARPQWGFDLEDVKVRGLDIVVAIDTSKSMLAEDIPPSRLARAKLAALDLMKLARADRLGLVAFAGSAFLQCPLTIDDAAFRQSIEALDVNIIPQGGTALTEAINTAMTAFKEGDNNKVLVLMTDGEDHDSGAVKAAEEAAKAGLHIYTIGIGTKEGEILHLKDASGKTDYIRDQQGNMVKSHLNEALLQEIAGATERGFYLPLRGAKTIETLYQDGLASLPKSDRQEKLIKQYHERYQWPLAIAIILLLTEMLFPERKSEKKSRTVREGMKAPVPAATAALLLLLSAITVSASPSAALRDYRSGKYSEALQEYERLLEKQKDDPRLHFNAGAAAFRSKQFEEATKQFDQALATPDLKLQQQAYFNRGNALFHLGEGNDDPKKKTEQWERSLKDFEIAGKLNQQDSDAKFNYDFVKHKLEELKKQDQQQQNDKNKDDKDKKDDQQKQDKGQQNQDQKDQQKKDQQSQDQKDQKDQRSKQNDQDKQDQQQGKQDEQKKGDQSKDKKDQQQQDQQKKDEQKPNEPQDPSKENSEEQQKEDAQAAAAGQMTPQQAKQLLDAQKGQEQLMPVQPKGKPTDASRPIKDW